MLVIEALPRLKAGMVITIEPGIYVPPAPQFPKQYHNLGIRIEDEVLVGPNDPVVLTASAPKEVCTIPFAFLLV
jgi:intermediate cleaving peptidase 55